MMICSLLVTTFEAIALTNYDVGKEVEVAFHWSYASWSQTPDLFLSWSSSIYWWLLVQAGPYLCSHCELMSHSRALPSHFLEYFPLSDVHLSPADCLSWSAWTFALRESYCEPRRPSYYPSTTITTLLPRSSCCVSLSTLKPPLTSTDTRRDSLTQ